MSRQNFFWAGNVKFLRRRHRMSQDELAERLGISRSKLNAHENGQTRNPTVEDLVRFSEHFRIGIDTLLKVDLTKLSGLKLRELEAGNDPYATGTQLRVLATTVDTGNNDNVELVPVKAKAGYTSGYGDPDYIAGLPVFHLPHLPRGRKYRMFPTSGDSMHPVPEQAFVIGEYLEDWTSLKKEKPCIVVTRNEGIVFKMAAMKEKKLLLRSLNPAYAPYVVHVSEVLEIWLFRSYMADTLPDPVTGLEEVARMVREIRDRLG